MNLFEAFVRLTHMHIPCLWEETTASFTGRTRKATIRARKRIIEASYDAYEITYYAADEEIHSWHTFHPLQDPDPETLTGATLRIRYKKRKPQVFEILPTGESNERDRI